MLGALVLAFHPALFLDHEESIGSLKFGALRRFRTGGGTMPTKSKPNCRRLKVYCGRAARWARYLYFMRFGILLWFFPVILVCANCASGPRSLISGIVTPTRWLQYLCVSFFLIASSFVALILVRIVVINGGERFHDKAPACLTRLLADTKVHHEWISTAASQLNTLFVFVYFLVNGKAELVSRMQVVKGFAAGLVLAVIFWYAVNALYYLTYQAHAGAALRAGFGEAAARTMVLPRSWMLLSKDGTGHRRGDVLEDAGITLTIRWISVIFPVHGYRKPPHGNLYEGHYFALVAACGFFALYWVLLPVTAPVPAIRWSCVMLSAHLLVGICVSLLTLLAQPSGPQDASKLRFWKLLLVPAVLIVAGSIPLLYFGDDAERFPIFALVLILVISCSWALGAIAFFADRFRVPVLTLILLTTLVPRLLHWDHGSEEHYLSTATAQTPFNLPTPAAILAQRLELHDDHPLFIVTATGGGIHAAAWTAAVLRKLEIAFAKDPSLHSFHDHVLLMSTVSGGSSGLYTYLRELDPATNSGHADWGRMVTRAQCSSLEAVGWGLVYYDLPKAFVPFASWVWPLSTGTGDLAGSPLGKDRTWALRKAFARNLGDPFCLAFNHPNSFLSLSTLRSSEQQNQVNEDELTIAHLGALNGEFPAFTMNTTTVENGERFLLANYRVPDDLTDLTPDYRARSFLATYGKAANPFDLPLATAAQMSATFPFVSSAARVPQALDDSPAAVHFVDGGYFDNDGTVSAIEFLRYALDSPPAVSCNQKTSASKPSSTESASGTPTCKLRVILIEIRNSGDISPSPDEATTPDHSGGTQKWNFNDEAFAPIVAFWNAGHESVTGRNRVALEVLEKALGDRAEIRHVVISDNYAKDRTQTDPLNWSLTPQQQGEIWGSAAKVSPCYDEVMNWFRKSPDEWNADITLPEDPCVPPESVANARSIGTP
jgi:hypothetical protein